MSSDRIYLSREEQRFLMDMLEIDNPNDAVDRFAYLLALEKADPTKLQDYLKKLMERIK